MTMTMTIECPNVSFAKPVLPVEIPHTGKLRLRKYQKCTITDGTEAAETLKDKIRMQDSFSTVEHPQLEIESMRLDKQLKMTVVLASVKEGQERGPAFERIFELTQDEYEYFINACRK